MGMITWLGAFVICVIAAVFCKRQYKRLRANRSHDEGLMTIFNVLFYVFIVGSLGSFIASSTSCLVQVPAGHVGVVTRFGQTFLEPLPEGLNLINPLNDVTLMSTRVQKDEEVCNCETSDTQAVSIKIITNWRPDNDKMPTLYKTYGKNYADVILPPAIKECVKAEVARYKVIDIVVERSTIHKNVEEKINLWLAKYGLKVLEVGIADIDFSDKYDQAIENKQLQEQAALQKEYELKKTETEARMAAAKAKGEADSRIAAAEGEAQSILKLAESEAESLRIRGQAQAEYSKKVSESMNPLMIQIEYLKKWDGRLPVYTLGQGSQTMLMLPSDK